MVAGSLKKKTGKVMLSSKSILVHTCQESDAKRHRNHGTKTLTAVGPAVRVVMDHITDAAALKEALGAQGLPSSLQALQVW